MGLCDLWWEEEVILHHHESQQGLEGTWTNPKSNKVKKAKMCARDIYSLIDPSEAQIV